ncbi:hypothetical protein FB451DRAFT_1250334 [Mycena latifolia]|nr:hypothetical protein FB451DRAFT_1250334 [Mycena latifolia]
MMLAFAHLSLGLLSYERSVIPITLNITAPSLERVAFNIHGRGGEGYRWVDWGSLDAFLAHFLLMKTVEFETPGRALICMRRFRS